MIRPACAIALALLLGACATADKPAVTADLNLAYTVASAAESVYAASPHADPKVVADMGRLLVAAQAAIVSWTQSSSGEGQAAAFAAVAALAAYEAQVRK